MKLIRLVTEDSTGLFNNTFNEDLLVKPNSKLALQSLSIETLNNVIDIDSSNDEIQFQVSNGFLKTARLSHASYNRNNYNDLLIDIQNALNNETGYLDPTDIIRRNFGLEWKAEIDTNKKVSVAYEIGVNGDYEDKFNIPADKLEFVTNLTRRVLRPQAGQPSDANNDRSALFDTYISRGCSFIRARTHKYATVLAPPRQNGYIIGLSKTNISALQPNELTDAMLSYGIAVTCLNNARRYYTVADGVYTLSATLPNFNGDGDVNNDYQEVMINFNKVTANIYQNGDPIPVPLFDAAYTAGEKLYPFIVFRGTNGEINSIRTIPSPYGAVTQGSEIIELAAPPQPQRNAGDNFIEFSQSLGEFLGFQNPRRPQNGFINAVEVNYTAGTLFEATDIADAFVIELLNLRCESYDGLKQQRKNILAVVPKSNQGGELIYETNTPFFIDLNNAKEILLRNIKIRVVRPDYSEIRLLGTATMVLLLDDK
jgi:hypothetical protein